MTQRGGWWIVAFILSVCLAWPCIGYADEPVGVPLGNQIKVVASAPKLNRKSGAYEVTLKLTNAFKPKRVIYSPFTLALLSVDSPDVALLDITGTTAAGQPYRTFSLPGGDLQPGKPKSIVFRFSNPSRRYFKPKFTAYGLSAPNHPPTADAGPDRTVFVADAITLDDSASTDSDGHPLTYRWALLDKPANSLATLMTGEGLKSGFTIDLPGTYQAQLVVNDRITDGKPDLVAISTGNSRPVAKAGPDQTQRAGATVTLDGAESSDINGDPLSFHWTLTGKPKKSTAKLAGAKTAHPTLKLDRPGHYTAQLVVNDGQADSEPDGVEIDTANSKPVANAGPDQPGGLVGVAVALDGSASGDADRNALRFRWSLLSRPAGSAATLTNANAQVCSFVPDQPGDYVAQLIVNDGKLDSAPDTTRIVATSGSVPTDPTNPTDPTTGNHAPQITSTAPTTAMVGQPYRYAVTATDADNDSLGYALSLSPAGMVIDAAGTIQWTPSGLPVGNYSVTVKVSDGKGGQASQSFQISLTEMPKPVVPGVTGLTRAAAEAKIQEARFTVGTPTFRHDAAVADGVVLSQSLAAGSQASEGTAITLVVSLGPDTGLPPDPQTVAPQVNQTVATTVADSTKFLYSGPNAVQTGVAAGTIEAKRAAVVRGRVLDKQNRPLPGVVVTVKDHPELGQTKSRDDGQFDLAVNGGGTLTLDYVKGGYLPAQRLEDVPWQDYATLNDVVLIPVDPKVSRIDLTSSAPIQVAQGSVMSDASGSRQATLMIPKGTKAQVYNPDGSLREVSTLTLHFSEYTVGANGPETMPGPLPPTSGYTYALEITAEEATIKKNGKDVVFSQPVPMYEDNFLNMPVGIQVPVAYYDRDRNAWIPADDGKVIKILSASNGLADIDSDGDGAADSAATLNALKCSEAERAQLAGLFAPGKTLWRTLVGHLSNYDKNYGTTTPNDAITPANGPAKSADSKPNQQCPASGSIIGCEGQTLAEEIPVTGTPFVLRYDSDRTAGRKAANSLDIPLSPASVPPSLKRIELSVEVAGRTFTKTFPAQANLTDRFEWDGMDAYGRAVQGGQPANVRIDYVYDGYYALPPSVARSFGAVSGQRIAGDVPSRQEIKLTQTQTATIGITRGSAAPVGLWSLGVHHVYDPIGKVLLRGDGSRQDAKNSVVNAAIITTIAGTGSSGFSGDGGPAKDARLNNPHTILQAADGSYLISDRYNHRIRRIGTDGTIITIAGSGSSGNSGDGGPATAARFSDPFGIELDGRGNLYIADNTYQRVRMVNPAGIISTVAGNGNSSFSGDGGAATAAGLSPHDIALTADGTLYIADRDNNRIRKVAPDGIISTVTGTGVAGFSGDGGPALAARINYPSGLEVDGNGNLYIADTNNHRIRRIAPNGIITTVAGTGTSGYSGDGGRAIDAKLRAPHDLVSLADGSLYIADADNNRIRRVAPDGTISTVVGTGSSGYAGDGGAATAARIGETLGVFASPDGSLLIADYGNNRIRRIAASLPGLATGDIVLPSEDGAEVYVFDANGRHLRTVGALTGATLLSFAYDSAGRLSQVTDATNNITTIERDALGHPTAIVAPFGQRTALAVDANGYLASVSNPAGEAFRMAYTADGLLTEFKDPKGQASSFAYDGLGRLTRDQNASGGSQNLARADLANGYEVTRRTGLNRATQYRVENLATGDEQRTVTAPDSTQTVTLTQTDGTVRTTAPDGTVTTLVQGPDPRFSMQAPIPKSLTVATGGLTLTAATERTATLSDTNNPLSLTKLTDKVTLNNRTSTRVYDAATKKLTATSAANRVSTATLDTLGRVVQTQVTGLLAVNGGYDAKGRLASLSQGADADQRGLAFAYNDQGWLKTVTDPLNRTVNFEYDAGGRVTRQVLPDGRDILYGYDANGNLTSLTPPGQPAHLFKYGKLDQTSEYDPPSAANTGTVNTLYEYDLDKALTRITRPDSLALNFAYDSAGRLAKLTTPDGDTGYAYAATGQLASITVPDGGKLAYAYNGALLSETAWTGAVAGKVGYGYDNDFRVSRVSVNGTDAIAYAYDADSLLTKAGSLSLARSGQNGLLTGTTLGKVTDALSYSGFGEVTSYDAKLSGASFFKTDYTRDKLGRITRKVEKLGVATNTYDYGYDTAGRLVAVTLNGVATSTYAYDDNGNRLSRTQGATVTQGSYDAQDRLLSYGGASYAYTANGELKSKTVGGQATGYGYDVLGNLRQVTLPGGGVIDYLIDGQNRRVGKKLNGALVQGFLWQDQLKPIAELDKDGKVVSRFVYATHANVPDYLVKGGATYRVVTDHLGSPRFVVNTADGSIAQQMDYDEFGNVVADSNPGFQPFGFAGGLYDPHGQGSISFT